MIHKLPHWVITHKHPAFYDSESATAIEQTAKLYRAFQDLVEDYNIFVDKINVHIEEYEASTDRKIEVFETAMRQEFQEFIDITNLKYADQENRFDAMMSEFNARIDELTTQINVFIAEKKAELDAYAESKQAALDAHALNKKNEFDDNFTDRMEELNAYVDSQADKFNVTLLIDQYNDNAAAKTKEFDDHFAEEMTELDTYLETQKGQLSVDSLIEDYNQNAATKVEEFETLVTNSKTDFNNNAITKTSNFNSNATAKTEGFDANAITKTNEYNQNAAEKLEELSGFDTAGVMKETLLNVFYPVGTYYETSISKDVFDPNTAWGGTWVLDTQGLVTVGVDATKTNYDTAGITGGMENVTLTEANLPVHSHKMMNESLDSIYFMGLYKKDSVKRNRVVLDTSVNGTYVFNSTTDSNLAYSHYRDNQNTGDVGSGTSFSVVQPYITVYRWHRTA